MFIRRRLQQMMLNYVRERGKATDRELYEVVKKMHELSYQQFLSLLMALEVEGFIELHYAKDLIIVVPRTQRRPSGAT